MAQPARPSPSLSPRERLNNWFYSIPAVTQWWAARTARRSDNLDGGQGSIPFARLGKPLSRSRLALITTAGVHLTSQPAFDMVDKEGDASFREIPAHTDPAQIAITHNYYNHSAADRDLNVVFPLAHLHDLVERGVVGKMAPRHFGFMGHIEGPHLDRLIRETAPAVAAKLRADGVEVALLTPA